MSFKDDAGDYTPISHALTKEVGLVCAAVYGLVWRYCQMKEGICRASLKTLGADISIDRATVLRTIEKLCKLGYLVDLTPDRRNAPHTYVLGKTVAQCNTSDNTSVVMRNSSEDESVAERNKTVAYNNSSIPTVAESYLKKEDSLKEESNPSEESKRERAPAGKGRSRLDDKVIPAFKVYVEITDFYQITKYWRGEMARIVGDKPEDLEFWRQVVIGWTGKYQTRHNVEGMLDYYKRREIPGYQPKQKANTNGTGYTKRTKQPPIIPASPGQASPTRTPRRCPRRR